MPAGRQGTERVAVIALPPADEPGTLRLADLDEILSRHLQACLDRLRAGGDEEGTGQAAGTIADQQVGQLLRRIGGEEGGVGICHAAGLGGDRLGHAFIAVPDTGDGGPSGGVHHRASVGQGHMDALAGDGARRRPAHVAMQNAAH